MNPFERHGVKHLSASSLACYRNEPSLWVLRYLYRIKDDAGPAAWRGQAVEHAVDLLLYGNDTVTDETATQAALAHFDNLALGELSAEIGHEREQIPHFVKQASQKFRPYGMPIARQFKIEHWLPGIEIPLIGFIDYMWEDFLVDLKTTYRLPSDCRPDHIAQVAIYAAAKERRPFVVYVSPKKTSTPDITDEQLKDAMWSVQKSAHAVRALLSVSETKEQAANLFCPNLGHWMWNDASREAAMTVWR